METCCSETTDQHFGDEVAGKDLQEYRRGRFNKTTRILLKALRPIAAEVSRLLDIGGGVGVILHELLDGSAMEATFVEIASAYLRVAREEAERRGYGGRVRFMQGDFVSLAGKITGADLVTLDRVVCCYPDAEQLIGVSASKSLKWYALSYPRNKWWVRLAIRFENWSRRRGGDPFQVHIHPETLMDEIIRREGFTRQFHASTLTWCVAIYQRNNAT
jgi:magnesium-protoporphyrin O-methyltransferase